MDWDSGVLGSVPAYITDQEDLGSGSWLDLARLSEVRILCLLLGEPEPSLAIGKGRIPAPNDVFNQDSCGPASGYGYGYRLSCRRQSCPWKARAYSGHSEEGVLRGL